MPCCLECGKPVAPGVHLFSRRIYGYTLCMKDQIMIEESGATGLVVDLYLALKSREFPVVLEYFDGRKHIDIALPGKLYIEINGSYHNTTNQILNDLSRTVYSLEKNIPTIIIPNSMLEPPASFAHAVNEISKACRMMLRKPQITGMGQLISAVHLQ